MLRLVYLIHVNNLVGHSCNSICWLSFLLHYLYMLVVIPPTLFVYAGCHSSYTICICWMSFLIHYLYMLVVILPTLFVYSGCHSSYTICICWLSFLLHYLYMLVVIPPTLFVYAGCYSSYRVYVYAGYNSSYRVYVCAGWHSSYSIYVCAGWHEYASQSIWTKGSSCNANSNKKLSTLSKSSDVTWPEKCKQTSVDSLLSSVPFVLNIYKKWNIWKLFSEHEILREVVKNCEVYYIRFKKSLDAAAGIGGLYLICR